MKRYASGFTLIEIAIVLVIIGLLLGGVLKGQELITGARVRNLISQQDGIKAAFFGFQDRFRALPGDYAAASTNINGVSRSNGNGNGRIENNAAAPRLRARGNPGVEPSDRGRLPQRQLHRRPAATRPRPTPTTPRTPTASTSRLIYDGVYGTAPSPRRPAKHNLKTGSQVPVEIIAEVDRKIDDGMPYAGGFQFSVYVPERRTTADPHDCVTAGLRRTWNISRGNTNCGGASLF